jgi:hypothetical protein
MDCTLPKLTLLRRISSISGHWICNLWFGGGPLTFFCFGDFCCFWDGATLRHFVYFCLLWKQSQGQAAHARIELGHPTLTCYTVRAVRGIRIYVRGSDVSLQVFTMIYHARYPHKAATSFNTSTALLVALFLQDPCLES